MPPFNIQYCSESQNERWKGRFNLGFISVQLLYTKRKSWAAGVIEIIVFACNTATITEITERFKDNFSQSAFIDHESAFTSRTKMPQVLMDNPDPKQTDAHNHLTLQIVTILKKNVLFLIASMLKSHLYSYIDIFHKRHNWSIRRKRRCKRNCLKL